MITLTPRAQQQLIVLTALDRGELPMARFCRHYRTSKIRQVRYLVSGIAGWTG